MLPDRSDWPYIETSRAATAAGLDWHVQIMGTGPVALLLHGTGGATHSWAPLVPYLTSAFTLVIPDLPGHGFTSAPSDPARQSMRGMAQALAALLDTLGLPPATLIVGHSAGAAVALRLVADRVLAPNAIVGLSAALAARPFGHLPPVTALMRAVATTPFVAGLATTVLDTDDLLASTGSRISPAQRELYRYLFRSPTRVRAILSMMAYWDIADLWRDAGAIDTPVTLVAPDADRWVPPSVAAAAKERLQHSTVVPLTALGHLAHEEAPDRVAPIIRGSRMPAPDRP